MSTFKKLFATIASAMVIASTLPAAVLGQASYGAELEGAYTYAYSMDVTTMGSIDAARMYDGLTRAELGKMMSNWAQAMDADLEADASMDCAFSDLAPIAGSDLEAYAVLSCQLGLMGVGTNGIFNPNGIVDRATFGTVLSRVIRGDKYDGGNPWYANHLSALNAAGVMTNISNPMAPEIRGYAMLMMQRADEDGVADGSAGTACDDGLVQLSCLLDLPDCPTECQLADGDDDDDDDDVIDNTGNEVSGDAEVSLANRQPANVVPEGVVGVEIATIVVEVGNGDSLSLNSIEMEATGRGDYADLDDVVLYDDRGTKVTRTRDVNNDGEVVLSFVPGYSIPAGGREELTIATTLNGSANGDSYGFTVTAINGPATLSGLPLSTQLVTAQQVNNLGELAIQQDMPSGDIEIGKDEILG